MYTAHGTNELFFPLLCTVMCDTPEALCAVCKMRGLAPLLQKPCWSCNVSGVELNLIREYDKNNFKELCTKIQQWNQALVTETGVQTALIEAKQQSMYIVEVLLIFLVGFFIYYLGCDINQFCKYLLTYIYFSLY